MPIGDEAQGGERLNREDWRDVRSAIQLDGRFRHRLSGDGNQQ